MRSTLADPREHLRIAAEALSRYTLRTALSVLGVVLGVAAVIAMLSVSDGARREALAQIDALGLDNLVAKAVAGGPEAKPLAAGDAIRLVSLVPFARTASPLVERAVRVSYMQSSAVVRVLGVTAAYQSILRLELEAGRFVTAVDVRSNARVCVVGERLRRRLFAFRDPIGAELRIGPDYYRIVGVLREHGADPGARAPLAWRDVDDSAFVPIAGDRADEVWVQLADGSRAADVAPVLRHTLARLHGGGRFDVVSPRELLAQRYRTQRTFAVVIGSVAVLALLVGGIGIMNIMLTSVVERTREIGLRRTVGARRHHIAMQFLIESLLMTMTGGAAGIVIGAGASAAIAAYARWPTHVAGYAIVLAVAVSFVVGVAFGSYPAIRAARLQPVDAVRYE